MIVIEREVVVTAPATQVFDYLADFETTEEWDPGTVRTVRTDGDGGIGTTYRNTSRFAGRESDLIYVVQELARPLRVVLRGENKTVVARDTMTFRGDDRGTTVSYRAEFRLKGLARLAEPFLRPQFKKLGDNAEQGLRDALGRLP
ncbi:SRPBCC family protein [Kribbella sp. NPDC055071]